METQLKCVFLFLIITLTFKNFINAIKEYEIYNFEIILWGIGIVGFIYLQWWK